MTTFLTPNGGPFNKQVTVDVPEPVSAIFDAAASIGEVLFIVSDGHVDLAQANDRPQTSAVGMSLANVAEGMAGTYQTHGPITKAGWGLSPGVVYYLDPTVPGGITTVYPTESGQFVVILGSALNETTLNLNIHWLLRQR